MRFTSQLLKILCIVFGCSSLAATAATPLRTTDYVRIRKMVAKFEWTLEAMASEASPRTELVQSVDSSAAEQILQHRQNTTDDATGFATLKIDAQIPNRAQQTQWGISQYHNVQTSDLSDFGKGLSEDIQGWIQEQVAVTLTSGSELQCERFFAFKQPLVHGLIQLRATVDCAMDGHKFRETLNSFLDPDTVPGDIKAANFTIIRVDAAGKTLYQDEAPKAGFSPTDLFFSWPTIY